VLFLGAAQRAVPARARRDGARTGQLMYELSKLYPAIAGTRPEYAWMVPVSMASDGFVCIGPHRNYPRHLFALGPQRRASATRGARAAAPALGTPDKGDELFGFTRPG
jgi:glycine/D-amino acid oxidase-like deaminating enzyme